MADSLERLSAALAERYRLDRQIGAGAMATVYLAEDLKHHREVAIKVLKPQLTATLAGERFLREVEFSARLTHPHILGLFDSGAADGFLYYVMPYVKGETLRDRLESGPMAIPEACHILRDVADALAYAHRHAVVHRDIKPGNILLADGHAMVMDFGVARALTEAADADESRSRLTTPGTTVGTPAYMAPEQAAADPDIDARADLYAFGVVAYEIFSGRPPFAAATTQQVVAAHVTRTPEPLGRRRGGLPPAVETLVMQCLEKDPARRPRDAGVLLPVLEAIATGAPVPAGALPASGRIRAGWIWAGVAAVLVSAIAVVYLTTRGH
ncbi:MAG: serine/threonine protein kinase [Gemmatimonadota bacterium]|nr:serine/threonine protein kinase [Gemmatimonadota bacterium]MDE3172094.1 serine/threonine protein kinase [Gemmatimonadota bacterium]MDE3216740.1 serine/threonine protein kinase [Gemmatimonadota bacterium]